MAIYVYCEVGFRGYLATRLLLQKGFKNVRNLTGGYKLYNMAQSSLEEIAAACGPSEELIDDMIERKRIETDEYIEVDACGLSCPGPLNAMIKSLETLPVDKKLKIYATDPGFKSSVEAYAKLNEAIELIYLGKEQGKLMATLEKRETVPLIKSKKKSRKELRGLDAPPVSEMSPDELYNRLDTEDAPAILIDVRTPQEYNGLQGHIQNARLIPLGELVSNTERLAQYTEDEIVTICHSGARSMMASKLLARAGFKDIRNLTGGIMVWHRKGYPVIREG